MNALAATLAMVTATAVTGSFLVAAFSLGLYGWPAVLFASGLGALGAGALARSIEAEIKRRDPAWDEVPDRPRAGGPPAPGPRGGAPGPSGRGRR